ncbi:MAG: hypothetical protein VX546_10685 [Myxococcota bacterium]|nr:hypothetical protein [Myxococcota bacterium]
MRPRPGTGFAAAVLGCAALLAVPVAWAVIPSAQKISNELARTNRSAHRSEPLIFDVTLRIGDSQPLAQGVLATHPTGLARLELTSNQGFSERHLLQGSAYAASRDGRMLREPRPFLPPLFLLQAGSGAALRAALASFGISGGEVALGLADDRDCYVLGGRVPSRAGEEERRLPSLWIDADTFHVVRIDRRDGVRFQFGPAHSYAGIDFPAWISIQAPGQTTARLDIVAVAPANAPAAAFGQDWLRPIP